MIVLRGLLKSVKMSSGEWQVVFIVPQSETESIGVMCNTCQEVALDIGIKQVDLPIIGKSYEEKKEE